MKKQPILTAAFVATGLALAASSANAATIILSEDFQAPVANNLRLDDTTTHYAGWQFTQGSGNIFVNRQSPANGLPGGADGAANQGIQFEWDGSNAEYDTAHTWSADDEFTLTFNATEMNWSNVSDRWMEIEITETFRDGSGNLTGTTLWTQNFELAQYDTAHDGSAEGWSAAQTFSVSFSAADFTGGTEGSALTFEVGGAGLGGTNRGMYVDNINLTFVPEPTTTALLGLGGLALILRRRK